MRHEARQAALADEPAAFRAHKRCSCIIVCTTRDCLNASTIKFTTPAVQEYSPVCLKGADQERFGSLFSSGSKERDLSEPVELQARSMSATLTSLGFNRRRLVIIACPVDMPKAKPSATRSAGVQGHLPSST